MLWKITCCSMSLTSTILTHNMSRHFERKSRLADWQIAPTEYELSCYDEPKIRYRNEAHDYINSSKDKNIRTKKFTTISTNVLCADITTSKPNLDPIEKDLYLPLEIALTKWSLEDANTPRKDRKLETHIWLINPGPPTRGCVNYAAEHKKQHKIDYCLLSGGDHDVQVSTDYKATMKDINSKIGPDRVVFSLGIKYCRQDLGCLKWLARESRLRIKPIKVFSLEDFYVLIIRRYNPEVGSQIGQGFARHRMVHSSNTYDTAIQCHYHQYMAKEDDGSDCGCCARAMAESYTQILLDDVKTYSAMFEEDKDPETPTIGH